MGLTGKLAAHWITCHQSQPQHKCVLRGQDTKPLFRTFL